MPHVVLLGDSVFDNGAYTQGAPDVLAHLRVALPPAWQASLLARDGATARNVTEQLAQLPGDASHLVVSMGGNDALYRADVLNTRVGSSAQAFALLADALAEFADSYGKALTALLARRLPLTLCTIYNGRFDDPAYQRIAQTALATFNDCIIGLAVAADLDVIELRRVCRTAEDFANPIEPSGTGGARIARAIALTLAEGGGARGARVRAP